MLKEGKRARMKGGGAIGFPGGAPKIILLVLLSIKEETVWRDARRRRRRRRRRLFVGLYRYSARSGRRDAALSLGIVVKLGARCLVACSILRARSPSQPRITFVQCLSLLSLHFPLSLLVLLAPRAAPRADESSRIIYGRQAATWRTAMGQQAVAERGDHCRLALSTRYAGERRREQWPCDESEGG